MCHTELHRYALDQNRDTLEVEAVIQRAILLQIPAYGA